MFASIAPRYDLLNHLLSFNIDRLWRRRLVGRLQGVRPSSRVLDVCTGTGDLAIQLSRKCAVVGVDFCQPMLVIARDKIRSRRLCDRIAITGGDALRLPFRGGSFDAVTVAFGVRNLENLEQGLQEFARVLRSGGVLAILEFTRPAVPIFRELFQVYFNHWVPAVGRAISGREGPYRYLPDSVNGFPDQERLSTLLERCGFCEVRYDNFSAGIAALHLASRAGR
ncbi:MAG: bifunctional demethylmenaquinone methyltransferase/2-methoxy-6-polyprenyl-1,4-benzoquinol methylase UbiE [Acidobacteria bacterium]|nr:bifunctional demethylmenaquinone methyltransferase/2-methoxy-6-polyprenyl-1,4-benzoquinol methylase UbiE [Acidobacteriota bacterium]